MREQSHPSLPKIFKDGLIKLVNMHSGNYFIALIQKEQNLNILQRRNLPVRTLVVLPFRYSSPLLNGRAGNKS
jgi:hypothetical protein